MWPGCSVAFNDLQPSLSVPYSDAMTMDEKVDQALAWLDLPFEQRPEFIGLYVPQVDQAGHREGPFANEASFSFYIFLFVFAAETGSN